LDLSKCIKVINDKDVSVAWLASNVPQFSSVYVCYTHHKHTEACGKDNTEALGRYIACQTLFPNFTQKQAVIYLPKGLLRTPY